MSAQCLERAPLDGAGMRGGEMNRRRRARFERLLPARGAQTPAVAGLQTVEAVLGMGRAEVVALLEGESEELLRHPGAHEVHAGVGAVRAAAAVAHESGQRIEAARLQLGPENVARHLVS